MARFTPSPLFRAKVARIESAGDPLAKNPRSSASGLFQFMERTAGQYGLADPFDPTAATDAFDALAADNYATLKKKLGRAPSDAEMYLAHQQGATGAAKILKGGKKLAKDVVGAEQVKLNGGTEDMTAEEFAGLWLNKYEAAKPIGGEQLAALPPELQARFVGDDMTADPLALASADTDPIDDTAPEPDPIGAGEYLATRFAENQTRAPEKLLTPSHRTAATDLIQTDAAPESEGVDLFEQRGIDLLEGNKKPLYGAGAVDGIMKPDTGLLRTGVDMFNQGTTASFADEITDPLGAFTAAMLADPIAAMSGEVNDPFLAEQIAGARESTQRNLTAQREQSPWLSAGANIAGALTGAAGARKFIPNAAATKMAEIAKTAPILTSAAVGGGGAALNAAGASTKEGFDRLNDIGYAPAFGAVGGALGAGLVKGGQSLASKLGARYGDTLGKAADSVKGGAQAVGRALGILDDVTPAQAAQAAGAAASHLDDPIGAGANITPLTLAGVLDDADLAKLNTGKVLPLTAGDRTQDVIQQRAEQTAATFGAPDSPINLARATQREAMIAPFKKTLGDGQLIDDVALAGRTQDEIGAAAGLLRGQYDDLGRRVNAGYATARELSEGAGNPIAISGEAVRNNLLNNIQEGLAVEAYQKGDIPKLDKHLSDLAALIDDKVTEETTMGMYGTETALKKTITPAKLAALENWKKRLNRTIGNSLTEPADARLLKQVGAKYDEFLSNLADDAIVNGDETAINAFKNARGLAKEKFAFYESDKGVAKLLDNRELSGSQLVNVVLGATKIGGKGDDGRIVETMLRLAGDKAPEMRSAMQKGIMSKVLNDAIRSSGKADTKAVFDVAGAMNTSLKNLMKNRETFAAVFDDTEQKYLKQLATDLESIAGKQIGAINRSASGTYTSQAMAGLGRVLSNPLFNTLGGLARVGLEKKAAAELIGKAESGLDEFLVNAVNQIDAAPVFYGGYAGGSGVDPLAAAISEEFYSREK